METLIKKREGIDTTIRSEEKKDVKRPLAAGEPKKQQPAARKAAKPNYLLRLL